MVARVPGLACFRLGPPARRLFAKLYQNRQFLEWRLEPDET